MLNFPAEETGAGSQRTRFTGLKRSQIQVYFTLAGTAEPEGAEDDALTELPTNWTEMLRSGDEALISDALAQIDEQEENKTGPSHKGAMNVLEAQHAVTVWNRQNACRLRTCRR